MLRDIERERILTFYGLLTIFIFRRWSKEMKIPPFFHLIARVTLTRKSLRDFLAIKIGSERGKFQSSWWKWNESGKPQKRKIIFKIRSDEELAVGGDVRRRPNLITFHSRHWWNFFSNALYKKINQQVIKSETDCENFEKERFVERKERFNGKVCSSLSPHYNFCLLINSLTFHTLTLSFWKPSLSESYFNYCN